MFYALINTFLLLLIVFCNFVTVSYVFLPFPFTTFAFSVIVLFIFFFSFLHIFLKNFFILFRMCFSLDCPLVILSSLFLLYYYYA